MKRIALVTVDRSDAGLYAPILERLRTTPDVFIKVLAFGCYYAQEMESGRGKLELGGIQIDEQIKSFPSSDTYEEVGLSLGLGVQGFSRSFALNRPDLLVVMGDRFEMFAAAIAALPFRLPVAHIHGGEITEGAMDDAIRHAMTKISHIHFASTVEHGRRIERMGEEPWRIIVSGSPGLDHLNTIQMLSPRDLEHRLNINGIKQSLLVTFHPATLEEEDPARQIDEILASLANSGRPLIFTSPNADPRGKVIFKRIQEFALSRQNVYVAKTLGTQVYFSLMAVCAAMVGNSSSGLIEAPSFSLPVVNVGSRQRGRTQAKNVINVDPDRESIGEGLRCALAPTFRSALRGLTNPYRPCTSASEQIVRGLMDVPLDQKLIQKKFYDGLGQ
ncbi:MAG: UDP-N-acetylglucosamine 2-epimerase (hydrolyzing) [Elusimicrobia bacterium]|mgnify:CR=1 FL=1|nr:UDP-N-acetylglucosamine 2-epimerase (hydrolyzing) [Elusimicrobiota bacterium]